MQINKGNIIEYKNQQLYVASILTLDNVQYVYTVNENTFCYQVFTINNDELVIVNPTKNILLAFYNDLFDI